MRILYEGAIFQILRCGGVARCFSETISHLPDDCIPSVIGPQDLSLSVTHSEFEYHGVKTDPRISWLRKVTRDRMQRQIRNRFQGVFADVEHWTYYNGLCRRPIERGHRPLVVTVLDFVHEAFPSLDPSGQHIAIKYDAIRAADHLICISEATHRELCERVPEARGKATVVPLGTSLGDVKPDPLPDSLRGKPYVLFVGRRNNYKNFDVVWKAWRRLRGALPADAKLAVVGPPMKRKEAAALGWDDDGSVILFPNVADTMLRTLYEYSQAFLFPSKAEGFGLPSLEAMAAGAPVMVSDLPVMREVVGDCGYYFDPSSVEQVSGLIEAALTDRLPGRLEKVDAALRRAESFSWKSTAEKTARVYRDLVGQASDHPAQPSLCSV